MASTEKRVAQFVVSRANREADHYLSPSGVWFSSFDRARLFERCEDALDACREPGCRVRVVYDDVLLPGAIVPPSEAPARG